MPWLQSASLSWETESMFCAVRVGNAKHVFWDRVHAEEEFAAAGQQAEWAHSARARVDPADGAAYRRREFVDCYRVFGNGLPDQWDHQGTWE